MELIIYCLLVDYLGFRPCCPVLSCTAVGVYIQYEIYGLTGIGAEIRFQHLDASSIPNVRIYCSNSAKFSYIEYNISSAGSFEQAYFNSEFGSGGNVHSRIFAAYPAVINPLRMRLQNLV